LKFLPWRSSSNDAHESTIAVLSLILLSTIKLRWVDTTYRFLGAERHTVGRWNDPSIKPFDKSDTNVEWKRYVKGNGNTLTLITQIKKTILTSINYVRYKGVDQDNVDSFWW
jgi:hypothetical protein